MTDDLEHVLRVQVPWRRGEPLTECGLADATALTIGQLIAKVKDQGQKRAALTTCMTCWQQCSYRYIGDGLVRTLDREIGRVRRSRNRDHKDLLERELQAIWALIQAHPDEFYGMVDGLADTTDLEQARRARRAKGGA